MPSGATTNSDNPSASAGPLAPALCVSRWFNAQADISLESLRGRVVVLHAFQMLCPACVSHGLPQAMKVHRAFAQSDVAVLGLHTVFEHHDAMAPHALQAFLEEYRISFPVAVDRPSPNGPLAEPVPTTMRAYELRGTPSLVLIDRQGMVRLKHFGNIEDLALGALLGQLIAEPAEGPQQSSPSTAAGDSTGAPTPIQHNATS